MQPSWSVQDPHNPPHRDTDVHWIIKYIVYFIDILYLYIITLIIYCLSVLPNNIKNTKLYTYFRQNIQFVEQLANKQNLFSGDFNDLSNKGILRFILDKTNNKTENQNNAAEHPHKKPSSTIHI